jgi:hypothetical protein
MPKPKPRITREDFDALVRASGLTLSEEQKSELHAAYGYIEAMSALVRTGGGSAHEVLDRPWIAGRWKGQIEARATNCEFVCRQFAKAYDASFGQLGDGRGITGRHMLNEQLRVGGRGNAGSLVDVLIGERDTLEVTAPAWTG